MTFTALWACKRAYKKYHGPYPADFLDRVYRFLGVTKDWKICHLFSGVVEKRFPNEVTVDLNPNVKADFREDALHTHFEDNSFNLTLADPAYDDREAEYYQCGNKPCHAPKVKHVLAECYRITKPNGFFGILHFIVPTNLTKSKRVAVIAITEGANMRIRAFTLFQKPFYKKGL